MDGDAVHSIHEALWPATTPPILQERQLVQSHLGVPANLYL